MKNSCRFWSRNFISMPDCWEVCERADIFLGISHVFRTFHNIYYFSPCIRSSKRQKFPVISASSYNPIFAPGRWQKFIFCNFKSAKYVFLKTLFKILVHAYRTSFDVSLLNVHRVNPFENFMICSKMQLLLLY